MALRIAIVSLPLVTLHNRWGDRWMRHYAWFKLFSTQTRREKVSEIKENSCQLREFVTQFCLLFTVCPAGWKPGEKTVKFFITPTSCIYTCYTLFVSVLRHVT